MASDHFAFLAPFGKYVTVNDTNLVPFKNHWQIPIILDALYRKDQHHLVLNNHFSRNMQLSYLQAIVHNAGSLHQRQIACIYLDSFLNQQNFLHESKQLLHALEHNHVILMLAISNEEAWFDPHNKMAIPTPLLTLSQHPRCRVIVFSNQKMLTPHDWQATYQDQMAFIHLAEAEETDILTFLHQACRELETFHQVIIAETDIHQAYTLVKRYFTKDQHTEKTLLLLDSAAARINAPALQIIGALSPALLLEVLSTWLQIPTTHLLPHRIEIDAFTKAMQQRVAGQEMAIQCVAEKLLQRQIRLKKKAGPFCTLLLAGANHTGKKTFSFCLADYLFKQPNTLYIATLNATNTLLGQGTSLAELKFQHAGSSRYVNIQTILSNTPYAILLIDNITVATHALLDNLQEIIETGCWHDGTGYKHDCSQLILLLSTTLGSQQLSLLTKQGQDESATEEPSLLQLVLNMQEQKSTLLTHAHHISHEELSHLISAEIKTHFPQAFLHILPIVPFLPLNKFAIESIIHSKLKSLIKTLKTVHAIELNFATEVMRYLNQLVANQTQKSEINIEQALQPLYFLIEQAMINQKEYKPNQQLFLQLNETGQALRCDWVNEVEPQLF